MKKSNQGYRTIGQKTVYFRSSWEANLARIFELEDLIWEFEPCTFWFTEIKRGTTSYKPDFYIASEDCYYEVKGRWCKRSLTKKKRMAKYFPEIKIKYIDTEAYYKLRDKYKPLIKDWEGR